MKDGELESHIDELYDVILSLGTREDCKNFFGDLCTYKEVEQMALRAYAAKLFLQGNTYNSIIEKTELSSATISRVSRSLTHGAGGYQKFIKR